MTCTIDTLLPQTWSYPLGGVPDVGTSGHFYLRDMASVFLAPSLELTRSDRAALRDHPIYGARPLLRGRFHQAGALMSVPIGIHLVTEVASPGARLAVIAYAVTCTLMFSTSAAYHRVAQGVTARFWMRRLDHSMIFVHIAGATTPVALLGVGGTAGNVLLIASWTGAVAGAGLKMTRLTADHDPCSWVFPTLGLLPLLAVPMLGANAGWHSAALLVSAALTYTAGAVCFARKSPDPVPTVFGYHEVWHVFTLVAGGFQLALTLNLAA